MAINRDFIVVVGGRLATALVGLMAIRASTTFLSPEQYGQLALIFVVQTFCGLFLMNPIGQYINRHTHLWWDEGTLLQRLSRYGRYIILVSFLGAAVMFFVAKASSMDAPVLTAIALLCMIFVGTWNATLIPILNMLGFRRSSVLWAVVTVVVSLLSSVAFMQWFPLAVAWFSGQAVGMLVGAMMAFRSLSVKYTDKPRSTVHLIPKGDIYSYCFPLAVAAGLMWLQLSGYRLLVESYWGLAQLGFITVGLMLAGQIWGIAESLAMQFLYPYFFKRISGEGVASGREALSDLLNVLGPLYLILAGVTVVLAPAFVFLLVDAKFSDSVMFVMLGAGIECCRALANVFGNAVQVTKKTRSLALPYGVGAAVILSLLWVAAEREMDVFYVGVVLLTGAISMLCIMCVMMYKEVSFVLDIKRWGGASFLMLILIALGFGLPDLEGWLGALMLLGGAGGLSILFGVLMLWKNGALQALLKVKLIGKEI